MIQWARNRQRQVIFDGLKVMTVASQAERMGLIEHCFWCVPICVGVDGENLQMGVVSMVAIKRREV